MPVCPAPSAWALLLGLGFWKLTLTCLLRLCRWASAPDWPQLFPWSPWQTRWGPLLYFSALPADLDCPRLILALPKPHLSWPVPTFGYQKPHSSTYFSHVAITQNGLGTAPWNLPSQPHTTPGPAEALTKCSLGEWMKNKSSYWATAFGFISPLGDPVSLLFLFFTFLCHPKRVTQKSRWDLTLTQEKRADEHAWLVWILDLNSLSKEALVAPQYIITIKKLTRAPKKCSNKSSHHYP